MISGGSTPTVKKSSGRTSSATARQTPTKARSKNEADPATDADVEGDDGEGEREAEGHHLAARFVTLLPEGASPAHTATVGPGRGRRRSRAARWWPRQSRSTTTGAWSEAPWPARSSRSMKACVTRYANDGEPSTKSMRMPRFRSNRCR